MSKKKEVKLANVQPIYINKELHKQYKEKVSSNGQSIKFVTEKLLTEFLQS